MKKDGEGEAKKRKELLLQKEIYCNEINRLLSTGVQKTIRNGLLKEP